MLARLEYKFCFVSCLEVTESWKNGEMERVCNIPCESSVKCQVWNSQALLIRSSIHYKIKAMDGCILWLLFWEYNTCFNSHNNGRDLTKVLGYMLVMYCIVVHLKAEICAQWAVGWGRHRCYIGTYNTHFVEQYFQITADVINKYR